MSSSLSSTPPSPSSSPSSSSPPRAILDHLLEVALDAADTGRAVVGRLPPPPRRGRSFVLAVGKAAVAMARATSAAWGDAPGWSGLCVAPAGGPPGPADAAPPGFTTIFASHPAPDAKSLDAGRAALTRATALGPDDLLLALVSGGGSALLEAPVAGLGLADLQAINRALLASGAPIGLVNAVRKRLSRIKGGGLARAAAPARVVTLVASDVPGDDPADVASGPTLAGGLTGDALAEAWAELKGRLAPDVVARIAPHLAREPEPVAAGETHVVLSPSRVLAAIVDRARALGLDALNLGDRIEAPAEAVAADHASLVAARIAAGWRGLIVSGGEASVRVTGAGRGGRNAQVALALAIALDGRPGVHALVVDSDGVDGAGPEAGAVVAPTTLARARTLGLDPRAALAACDAHGFFAALGDGVTTGPTGANVNDLRLILVT